MPSESSIHDPIGSFYRTGVHSDAGDSAFDRVFGKFLVLLIFLKNPGHPRVKVRGSVFGAVSGLNRPRNKVVNLSLVHIAKART
jgi:hypothetical protein